jgi:hypothetical protein
MRTALKGVDRSGKSPLRGWVVSQSVMLSCCSAAPERMSGIEEFARDYADGAGDGTRTRDSLLGRTIRWRNVRIAEYHSVRPRADFRPATASFVMSRIAPREGVC